MGFFRPFSRDQGMKSGPRPHMALVDEVHEHASPEVINKLKAGFKFRTQPLAGYITNSGFDKTSICGQLHAHAEHVLRGTAEDEQFFAYVCGLDDDDDPLTDPSCWIKANPLLGVTITETYLKRQVQNAKNISAELNTVLRLNFCIWTAAHTRAIDPVLWKRGAVVISDDELAGVECYAGLDLGQSDDLSAFAKIWPLDDGRLVVRMRYWIPQSALERYPHRPYDQWKRTNILEVTEGVTTDYDTVETAISADCARWGVRELGYDNKFAEQLAQHLQGYGIDCTNIVQGFALNLAIRRLLELVAEAQLCHGGDVILEWMSANVVLRHGLKGDVRIDKEKAPEKIDGFSALCNAMMVWLTQPAQHWGDADPEVLLV
jgi:phage terminase large subunit-like protein